MGDNDEALNYAAQGLHAVRVSCSPTDPLLGGMLSANGLLLLDLGRYDEAERMLQLGQDQVLRRFAEYEQLASSDANMFAQGAR